MRARRRWEPSGAKRLKTLPGAIYEPRRIVPWVALNEPLPESREEEGFEACQLPHPGAPCYTTEFVVIGPGGKFLNLLEVGKPKSKQKPSGPVIGE